MMSALSIFDRVWDGEEGFVRSHDGAFSQEGTVEELRIFLRAHARKWFECAVYGWDGSPIGLPDVQV